MREVTFERLDSGKLRRVKKKRVVVGASAAADVRFGHPSVLSEHAYVRVESDRVDILAAGDEAVVEVDGIAVDGIVSLEDGQTVRVGQVEFRVWFDGVSRDVAEEATVQSFSRDAVLKAAGVRRVAKGPAGSDPFALVSEGDGRSSTKAKAGVDAPRENPTRKVGSKPTIQDKPAATESLPSIQVSDGLQVSKAVESGSGEDPPPEAIAATQLLSAFEAIEAARKRQAGAVDSEAKTVALEALDEAQAREGRPAAKAAEDSGSAAHAVPSKDALLEIGDASEFATQQLNSAQVEALYVLYERRRAAKEESTDLKDADGSESAKASKDVQASGDHAQKLSQILKMGPEAFGVKTWDEVAAAAASLEPEEDEAWSGLARLRDVESGRSIPILAVAAGVMMALTLLVLVMLIPDQPPPLDQEQAIEDLNVVEMPRVDHREEHIRCHTDRECFDLAAREFDVSKLEWDNRGSSYENRYRAFEHADRARIMLERGGHEMDALEGLEAQWNQARDELDAIYHSLRVSVFIALSRNAYEDAVEMLDLTTAYFPSDRSREWRWARHLRLTFKDRGIETQIAHKRSVDGRWDR